ncbi:MAG: hypothetical protein ACLPID_21475 [Beijerinckiaceae bacterium]
MRGCKTVDDDVVEVEGRYAPAPGGAIRPFRAQRNDRQPSGSPSRSQDRRIAQKQMTR